MDHNLKDLITQFMRLVGEGSIEVYNEFSLQHELGIYLRQCLQEEKEEEKYKYKVQFERNVNFFQKDKTIKHKTIKHEIDIVIYDENDDSERYAIELKCPHNGRTPETMYDFVKDIRFMEQLNELGFKKTYCLILVEDKNFYSGKSKEDDIYAYFRARKPLKGRILKPTGKGKNRDGILISGEYVISWQFCISNDKTANRRYCLVEVIGYEQQTA